MFLGSRPYLASALDVRGQVLYPQRASDAARPGDEDVADALRAVGLEELALDDVRIEGLSSGERQRLAAARIALRRPMFLIADEAVCSCPEAFEHEFFRRCIVDWGITCLTVSHRDAAEALHKRTVNLEDFASQHV
jgi:ABC-type uncharacterized transport system fused permease/ATPase subunit